MRLRNAFPPRIKPVSSLRTIAAGHPSHPGAPSLLCHIGTGLHIAPASRPKSGGGGGETPASRRRLDSFPETAPGRPRWSAGFITGGRYKLASDMRAARRPHVLQLSPPPEHTSLMSLSAGMRAIPYLRGNAWTPCPHEQRMRGRLTSPMALAGAIAGPALLGDRRNRHATSPATAVAPGRGGSEKRIWGQARLTWVSRRFLLTC